MTSAAPTGCNVVALAASDGLDLQLSGWSYQYLMDMVHGNLMHHQNSFEPYTIPGPSRTQHTTFNPNVKFGPSAGQVPYFALTLSSCSVQVRTMSLRSRLCHQMDGVSVRTHFWRLHCTYMVAKCFTAAWGLCRANAVLLVPCAVWCFVRKGSN